MRDGRCRVGALQDSEDAIRERPLAREAKRLHRLLQSKPHVEVFFDWGHRRLEAHRLYPKAPLISALQYARQRQAVFEVFLTDPDVSLDTSHLGRARLVIPTGHNNQSVCSTALGTEQGT